MIHQESQLKNKQREREERNVASLYPMVSVEKVSRGTTLMREYKRRAHRDSQVQQAIIQQD